ncbi:MAG: hypothetical protein IRY85_14205 [Micromonosporaceae bacterium]|nr:hypothetical protein [Micromonosporaceae bacterium]
MQALSSDRLDQEALFASLIDDAAVFPPRAAALADAVREHEEHRRGRHAVLIGPLLVPVSAAAEAAALLADAPGTAVSLIARPGAAVEEIPPALDRLTRAGVDVVGVEMGWFEKWRDIDVQGRRLALEVGRTDDPAARAEILADIRRGADAVGPEARPTAKFRTGATATWAWPDEAELAGFLRAAVDAGVSVKLTGGLHHLVRAERDGESQHGLLNVLSAVHRAIAGDPAPALAAVLGERDPQALVRTVAALDPAQVRAVRDVFVSYGCCDVRDPIGELVAVGLVAS